MGGVFYEGSFFYLFTQRNSLRAASPPAESLGRGKGEVWRGKGNLSLERFPFPPHFFLYFTSFLNHEIGCMDGSFV